MPLRRSIKSRRSFKKRPRRSRKKIGSMYQKGTFKVARPLTYANNTGLGKSRRVSLNYYEQIGLASVSGVPAKHTFNLASCHDPDVTGVGHQPGNWDMYKTLYRQYYVQSATISVKWTNIATNSIPHKVFVLLDKDNSVDANLDTRMERTKGVGTKTLLVNSNNTQVTKLTYVAKRYHSIQNSADDHQIKALVTSDPLLPAYAVIGIQPIDQVSDTSQFVYGEVMIKYNVVLFDPVPFVAS